MAHQVVCGISSTKLIRTIDYVKGPYHAEVGDFSSAGAAYIRTFDELERGRLLIGLGVVVYGLVLVGAGLRPRHLAKGAS